MKKLAARRHAATSGTYYVIFLKWYNNSEDVNHQAARALIRDFEGYRTLLVTTDYIFDEVMTVLLVRGNKDCYPSGEGYA